MFIPNFAEKIRKHYLTLAELPITIDGNDENVQNMKLRNRVRIKIVVLAQILFNSLFLLNYMRFTLQSNFTSIFS